MTRPAALDRVLCATDFSSFSTAALDWAVRLAAAHGATIRLLHVVTPFPITAPFLDVPGNTQLYDTAAAQARRSLQGEAERVRQPGLTVEIEQREGPAVQGIVAAAAEWPADLLVVGTHGHGGFERVVLGSVAEKVLRKAPCPVMAVPHASTVASGPAPLTHVLCAHDGSDASRGGVAYAMALAERLGSRLTLVSVVEPLPYGDFVGPEFAGFHAVREQHAREALDNAMGAADRDRLDVHDRIVYGHPGEQIVQVASQERPDLIVMGVQGRGALDLVLFGSTTHYVLRHTSTPVLAVRPTSTTAAASVDTSASVESR